MVVNIVIDHSSYAPAYNGFVCIVTIATTTCLFTKRKMAGNSKWCLRAYAMQLLVGLMHVAQMHATCCELPSSAWYRSWHFGTNDLLDQSGLSKRTQSVWNDEDSYKSTVKKLASFLQLRELRGCKKHVGQSSVKLNFNYIDYYFLGFDSGILYNYAFWKLPAYSTVGSTAWS